MDNQSGKSPLLALTVATMLFAALGVVMYTQAPYKGIRPSVQDSPEAPQKIRARLWQDPFQAVLDYETKRLAGSKPVTALHVPARTSVRPKKTEDSEVFDITPCQGITLEKEFAAKKNVTILAVMVLGGPYDGDIEYRICQRYAVLSALNVLHYYPDDPTHIKFLNIRSSPSDKHPGNNEVFFENIIPFEWLSSPDSKSVMLLWLNDDIFQENPIDKLEKLRKNIKEEFPFKIIGPATSTTLLKMIEENKCLEDKDNVPKMLIYSATATVDNEILLQYANIKEGNCIQPQTFLTSGNLVRTILPDIRLAKALVNELKNRGVKPGSHVVLVAEWDTEYGRSLPQRFKEVFAKEIFGDLVDKRVHRFSYLRGIDGKLPGEQNGSDKDKKKNEASNKEERDIKKLEEPLGKSQYDYLRRLAARIAHLEDEYGPGSIGAIGVLGNDFYDKFLVLQALQQRFPESIFFTTDLDARYLHPANIEWTRNLVVASSFGLQLREDRENREDLQGEVPPFRNAYQTSVFAATLLAFDYPTLKKDDFLPDNLKPRIFEIGRNNAIDLTNKAGNPVPINQAFAVKGFPYVGWIGFTVVLVGISSLVMLLGLSYASEKGIINEVKQLPHKTINIPGFTEPKNILLVGLIILVIFLAIVIGVHAIITTYPTEEPFFWSEGISVWPTEIIRFIAFILSVGFFLLSKGWLKDNTEIIYEEFGLEGNIEKKSNIEYTDTNTTKESTVNNKWTDYLSRSSIGERIKWIILVSLVYYVLCFIIIVLFGFPKNPVRGNFTSWLNFILLMLITIPAFLLLTFFVLDTIMLCRGFINQFVHNQPEWNIDSLKQFVQQWNKDPGPFPKKPEQWIKGKTEEALSEWMLVLLIARRTDVVGKLIFFPFIVWSLIIFSRLHYFDNWRTPLGLVIVISLSAVLAWVYAVNLRRSAEKLRTAVINRLDQQLVGTYADDPDNKADATCIQHVLSEVKAIKTGAFASYIQQPALQSLLVPIGGISGLKILELLSNLG